MHAHKISFFLIILGHYYERTESEDAKKFFQKAAEKFASALDKHPNDQEVLTNCMKIEKIIKE